MRSIIVIAHNLRSSHNVGSLLRTAEGLGVERVYLTGYTPYPILKDDPRLPHIARKVAKDIHKTALDADAYLDWQQADDVFAVIASLQQQDYYIVAVEQTTKATLLPAFTVPDKIALIVGREVEGIEQAVLKSCDETVEIPMFGRKESFNVVQAAAMTLYQVRFAPTTVQNKQ